MHHTEGTVWTVYDEIYITVYDTDILMKNI